VGIIRSETGGAPNCRDWFAWIPGDCLAQLGNRVVFRGQLTPLFCRNLRLVKRFQYAFSIFSLQLAAQIVERRKCYRGVIHVISEMLDRLLC